MKHADYIIDRLFDICGLRVEAEDEPASVPSDGILCDTERGRTVFCVRLDGKTHAFGMDGCDERTRVAAALAREYVTDVIAKSRKDPVMEFLLGQGGVPNGVHIGKSDYYVFAVHCAAARSGVAEYLSAMCGEHDFVADMTEGITAFCKEVNDDADYRSAGELAAVLKENISEEIKGNVKIGVGGVAHGVSELPLYYAFAKSALVGGAEFDPESGIYSYKEYALIKTLSGLPSVDKEQYVKTVLDRSYRDVLADAELVTAADAFIKHSLNISEASRSMYVHRNTLIYRLDKIEKLTGLNIRNFNDAMTFRIACLLYKML